MNKMMAMTVSAGGGDGGGVADHAGEGVAHHAPAGRREHQEEGAEQFGEQPPPLLARVIEVGDPVDDVLLVTGERASGLGVGTGSLRSWLPHTGVWQTGLAVTRPVQAAEHVIQRPVLKYGHDHVI